MDKEWAEVFKNRLVLFTVTFLPLIFLAIPLIMLYVTARADISEMEEMPQALLRNPAFSGMTPQELMQAIMVNQFMLFFLLLPLAIPMTIAAYSVVGEKTERSLEPLLATPIATWQLLLGKSLAAALPAVGATWLSFLILALGSRFLVVSERVYGLIVSPTWLLAIGLLSPLLAILAVTVGVIVSSRVNDPRAAEQLGMVVIVPILGLFFAQMAGLLFLGPRLTLMLIVVMALLDMGLLWLAVRLFQRETILTKWK
jgi:ABC-2 type transport system permease protein